MICARNEQTLAACCEIRGRGYWSGQDVRVRFLPAAAGAGVRIVRTDRPGQPSCPALTTYADEQAFRTNLCAGEARFEMIEHVLAALYALQIDNCVIEINGEEMPGLDGSALAITQALRSVGVVVQATDKQRFIVDQTFRVGDETCWIQASPAVDGHAHYAYHLDYGADSPIGAQSYSGVLNAHAFCHELAPARTFVTAQQVAQLQSQGVGKHVGPQDLLVFDDNGLVDNSFRFPNECARHKALDLIGDLALVGVELIGRFVSHRGGHRLNAALARQLAARAGISDTSASRSSRFAPPTAPHIAAA